MRVGEQENSFRKHSATSDYRIEHFRPGHRIERGNVRLEYLHRKFIGAEKAFPGLLHFRNSRSKSIEEQHSFPKTMNSFPQFLSNLARSDAAWTCSSCAKTLRQKPSTPFFNPSRLMRRDISDSSKTRQNVAPTMEQLRAPFRKKNSSTLYYTLSIILGTVAFSYGSVPMYKMVSFASTPHLETSIADYMRTDLPNDGMGRPTH